MIFMKNFFVWIKWHGKNLMETQYLPILSIFFLCFSDHPVLQVLSERQGDKVAQDFVKKQKERLLSNWWLNVSRYYGFESPTSFLPPIAVYIRVHPRLSDFRAHQTTHRTSHLKWFLKMFHWREIIAQSLAKQLWK